MKARAIRRRAKISIVSARFRMRVDPFKGSRQGQAREIRCFRRALERAIAEVLNVERLVDKKTVFIKPNLNFIPGALNSCAMTDPRLLLALCEILHEAGARRILIGEKPGQRRRSRDSYRLLKSRFRVPRYVELVDLETDPKISLRTKTHLVSQSLALPESYVSADVVVDLPKLKTHTLTGISLGMKNLFGLLTDEEKMRHHNEDIHCKLVDLLSVRRPDLTIIDGIIGMEGQGPLFGSPKKCGVLIVGDDCVAADATACQLMGIDPASIEHIALAHRLGLGRMKQKEIKFGVNRPAAFRFRFTRGNLNFNPLGQITIVKGRDVPSGYLNAISHSLERLARIKQRLPYAKLYVGRFDRCKIESSDLLFGDITIKSIRRNATAIPGHPPGAFALFDLLKPTKT